MTARVRALSAVGLLALWSTTGIAQQPTFHSATELVSLNVTVSGLNAKPVDGLTAEQFQVFEDGVAQEVKFFSPGDLPLDVIVLLDTSASMTGYMALVQQAAARFVQALRPNDRAAVMGISSGLRVLQTFTSDKTALQAAIKSSTPAGRTPLYASIYTALTELEKDRKADRQEARRQAVVVLSDGLDTSSTFTFEELLNVVHRSAVPIYAIAPRTTRETKALRERLFNESTHTADFELRKLATDTGGRAFFPVTLLELSGVYDEIANELAHQYSIGYQSSNLARDGRFRRIVLRVLGPGLSWRTRAGYTADRSAANLGGE